MYQKLPKGVWRVLKQVLPTIQALRFGKIGPMIPNVTYGL